MLADKHPVGDSRNGALMSSDVHSGQSIEVTGPPWWSRWKIVAFCALAIAVIAGAVVSWQWNNLFGNSAPIVTDGSYVFDPGSPQMAAVEHAIAQENSQVRTDGRPYVSIALLDPFTHSPSGDVSLPRIVDQLRGAYLAQQAMNASNVLGVQLLLVNEGDSTEGQEGPAVQAIESLEGAPDRIVAVAGMGLSTQQSVKAASALSANGMAMFGALPTADQFNGSTFNGFVQVTPNVGDQVRVLAQHLPVPGSAVLVYDQQATDLYTSDLQKDFSSTFTKSASGKPLDLHAYPFTPHASYNNDQFRIIAQNACIQTGPGGTPPVVFYAGRASVLSSLIAQFQQAPDCSGMNITIVTAGDADGLDLPTTQTPASDGGANVSVEYTDIENVNDLTSHFVASYKEDLATMDPGFSGLTDPWTIATYDSMMAAWDAIESAYDGSALPTAAAVGGMTRLLNGKAAPVSATNPGTLAISAHGQLLFRQTAIPIFRDANGTRTTVWPNTTSHQP